MALGSNSDYAIIPPYGTPTPQTDELPQFPSCKSGAGVLTQVCKLDCGPESHSHSATSVPPSSHVEVFLFPVLGNDRKMQASPGLSWRPCSQTVGEIIKTPASQGPKAVEYNRQSLCYP